MSLLDRLVQNSASKSIYYSRWDGPDIMSFKMAGVTSCSQDKYSIHHETQSKNLKNKRFNSQPKRQIQLSIIPKNPVKITSNSQLTNELKESYSQTLAIYNESLFNHNKGLNQEMDTCIRQAEQLATCRLSLFMEKTLKYTLKQSFLQLYYFSLSRKQAQKQKIQKMTENLNIFLSSKKLCLLKHAFNLLRKQKLKFDSTKKIQLMILKIHNQMAQQFLSKLKSCKINRHQYSHHYSVNQPLGIFKFSNAVQNCIFNVQILDEVKFSQQKHPTIISYIYQNTNILNLSDNNDNLNIFLDINNHKMVSNSVNSLKPFYETINSKFNFQSDQLLYEIEAQKKFQNQPNAGPSIQSLTVSNISHANQLHNSKTVRIFNRQPKHNLQSLNMLQCSPFEIQQQINNQFDFQEQKVTKSMLGTFQHPKRHRNYSSYSEFYEAKTKLPISEQEQIIQSNSNIWQGQTDQNHQQIRKKRHSKQQLLGKKDKLLKKFMEDFQSSPRTMKEIKAARVNNKIHSSKQKKSKKKNNNAQDAQKVSNTFKKKNLLQNEPFAILKKHKPKTQKKVVNKERSPSIQDTPQIQQQKYLNDVFDSIIEEAMKGKQRLKIYQQQKNKIKSGACSKIKIDKINYQSKMQQYKLYLSPCKQKKSNHEGIQHNNLIMWEKNITPKIKQFSDSQL